MGAVHPRKRHAAGTAAEYVAVPADRIALSPPRLPPSDAASFVVAGAMALTALRDSAGLVSGERILVRGATGGVGTALVHLGRAMGGHVTALARGQYAAPLAELGTDEIIDYRSISPKQTGPFDVIVDAAGSDLQRYQRTLTRNGRTVTVGLSAAALAVIALSSVHGSPRQTGNRRILTHQPAEATEETADRLTSDQSYRAATPAPSQREGLPASDSPYPESRTPEPDDQFVALDYGDDCFMELKPDGVGPAGWTAAGDIGVPGLARDLDGEPGNLRVAVPTRVGVNGAAAVSLEVEGPDRVRHRAERQVGAVEGDLGTTEPRDAYPCGGSPGYASPPLRTAHAP